MALADAPGCAMIWYEGALRDHLALDPGAIARSTARSGGAAASRTARRATACRRSIPSCAPGMSASSWASSSARRRSAGLARQPALMALVERLVGGAPALFQDMALVKPAQGREKPWHQDHAYLQRRARYADRRRLDPDGRGDARERLHAPAGRRPQGGRAHPLQAARLADLRHRRRRPAGRVAVPMRVGDVLLFDGKLPHGTPINRTDDFRWAVQYHYRPGRRGRRPTSGAPGRLRQRGPQRHLLSASGRRHGPETRARQGGALDASDHVRCRPRRPAGCRPGRGQDPRPGRRAQARARGRSGPVRLAARADRARRRRARGDRAAARDGRRAASSTPPRWP